MSLTIRDTVRYVGRPFRGAKLARLKPRPTQLLRHRPLEHQGHLGRHVPPLLGSEPKAGAFSRVHGWLAGDGIDRHIRQIRGYERGQRIRVLPVIQPEAAKREGKLRQRELITNTACTKSPSSARSARSSRVRGIPDLKANGPGGFINEGSGAA